MKLIKILNDKVQIKTDHMEFENVRINDLVSVSDGMAELITIVTAITDTDINESLKEDDFLTESLSMKVIECSIIGSIHNGKFSRSIEKYPSTNIVSKEIDSASFKKMLSSDKNHGFCIGEYVGYKCPAWVNGNKFFQRHACIVGNTGSGKSETVAKILEETGKLPGANIIVFDIHGEYSKLSYARNIEIGTGMFPFPIWMFGFSGMVSNILKVREESSSVVISALRKCYYELCPEGKENRPVRFDFVQLISKMERLDTEEKMTGEIYKTGDKAGTAKTVKGEFNGKLSGIINTMKDKMLDRRYDFLFNNESQEFLNKAVHLIMDNDRPVKNIDLSSVPHDVAIPIIGMITKLIYDIQRTYGTNVSPLTLVCDEAHVYIPTNFQLSASQRRMVETFEEIAKEGRKFGITLFAASQRPSELNKTIMSQCANFIVAKLNNENDKSMIKGMLPDGSESVIDSTTTFSPGEVLVIGDAVPIPMKIKVALAKERPQSRTIDFWDKWKSGGTIDLDKGLESYMKLK